MLGIPFLSHAPVREGWRVFRFSVGLAAGRYSVSFTSRTGQNAV